MKLIVKTNEPERLDKYLSSVTDYSRSKIENMIDEGLILVNNKLEKPSFKVIDDMEIILPDNYVKDVTLEGEDIPLDILYEDEYIIVVNKPSGLVVHPGAGNKEHTLVNALINHTKDLSINNGEIRPGIVHRIDKDTSGVLLVAKTEKVHEILAAGFKNKTIKRVYVALLKGVFPNTSATIDAPIGRDKNNRLRNTVTDENSKSAVTHLKVIKRFEKFTLVELKLETGRTHQIRVHMAYIKHPLINDQVYGNNIINNYGQMLHAKYIGFNHPISGEFMEFESPLEEEFVNILDKFRNS